MQGVRSAKLAVLFELQPGGQGFLVFAAVVRDALALGTFHFHEIILRHKKV